MDSRELKCQAQRRGGGGTGRGARLHDCGGVNLNPLVRLLSALDSLLPGGFEAMLPERRGDTDSR